MAMIRKFVAAAVSAAALAMAIPVARADMTQEQVQQLLTELKGIRAALEKMGTPAPAAQPQEPVSDKVSMTMPASAYELGNASAPIVMIEYTDLQCPFCQQFHNTAFDQIKKNYIDTGKVLFLSRDFPLDFHPWARPAAIAARCAGAQGKFWELRNELIANADKLSKEMITQHAADLKLDMKKFQSCADSDFYTADINKQVQEGTEAGVSGTPSFVIGKVENGKLDGVRLVGAMPYASFDAKIQELLGAPAK